MTEMELKRCRRSIAEQQWEQARPLLKQLYQDQGLKLKDVRNIMAAGYNFPATEQMYKKQFAKWDMRKNYTRTDKETISVALLKSIEQGVAPILPPSLLSTPAQMRRIKRYMREHAANTSLNVDEDQSNEGDSLQNPDVSLSRPNTDRARSRSLDRQSQNDMGQKPLPISLQNMVFRQAEETQAVEDVLLNARQYYTWFFTQHHFEISLHERPLVDAVFIRVQCARRLMAGGDNARAFLMIHLACENMRTMFEGHPFQLLLEFFRTFTKPGWAMFSGVRDAVLKQMFLLSRHVLGFRHPLSRLTELFMDADTMAESGSRFFGLLSEMISEHLEHHDQASGAQLILAECYIALDELDRAETICLRCLSGSDQSSLLSRHNIQKARKNLGCIRYKQGLLDEARRIWLEVHDEDVVIGNGNIVGSDAVINCTHLASLYEGKEDYQQSALFHKAAFEGALRTWGPVIVDLHEYFNSLQDTLVRSNNAQALEKLFTDYEVTMRNWDRRQVAYLEEKQGLANSLLRYGRSGGQKVCDFDAGLHRHFVC